MQGLADGLPLLRREFPTSLRRVVTSSVPSRMAGPWIALAYLIGGTEQWEFFFLASRMNGF